MTDEYYPPSAGPDLKRALHGIWKELARFRADGKNFDIKGQRLTNVGPGLVGHDSATLKQLADATSANAIAEKVRGEFLPSGTPRTQYCLLSHSIAQSINQNAFTAITWDTEDEDRADLHTTALPTRITIKQSGLYKIRAEVSWVVSAVGTRWLQIRKNNASVLAEVSCNAVAEALMETAQEVNFEGRLAGGDFIIIRGKQSTAGALGISVVADFSPRFSILGFNS